MTSYPHPQNHLDDHLSRLRWMLQRHLRRHADRLVAADERYSDECIGVGEMRRILGIADEKRGEQWLDKRGVAQPQEIDSALRRLDAEVAQRSQAARESLPIESLRDSFGLTDLEVDLLLAAAAPRLSPDLARIYCFAWADFSLKQPTASFLCELTTASDDGFRASIDALDQKRTLRRCRLLRLHDSQRWQPETPLLHATVSVPQRVIDHLRGVRPGAVDLPGCTLHRHEDAVQDPILHPAIRDGLETIAKGAHLRARFVGPGGVGRRTVLQTTVAPQNLNVLEVDVALALSSDLSRQRPRDLLERLAEILREAQLHHAVTLLNLDELSGGTVEAMLRQSSATVRALLDRHPGGIAISTTSSTGVARDLLSDPIELIVPPPAREDQVKLWRRVLAREVSDRRARTMSHALVGHYQLTPGAMVRALDHTLSAPSAASGRRPRLCVDDLLSTVRRQLDHNLGWLADPYTVQLSLDEVVLSEEIREQIAEVLRYARHSERIYREWGFGKHSPQGRGLSVMFSGPPGTGKSLVAGVLARELGRAIYRIDLSRVVDKYIGETEKNLARVFDEAERAQAVLLFDEADSLFGKRTEIKSSNDRYANLEVNFLLQRLEAFDGVSVLTTNLVSSIDDAFQRRIRFKIDFPMPEGPQRTHLWRTLLPPQAPVCEETDFERLGEAFELTGGHIRNAVLRAAVSAADRDTPINTPMLWEAAAAECRELGLLVNVPEYYDDY